MLKRVSHCMEQCIHTYLHQFVERFHTNKSDYCNTSIMFKTNQINTKRNKSSSSSSSSSNEILHYDCQTKLSSSMHHPTFYRNGNSNNDCLNAYKNTSVSVLVSLSSSLLPFRVCFLFMFFLYSVYKLQMIINRCFAPVSQLSRVTSIHCDCFFFIHHIFLIPFIFLCFFPFLLLFIHVFIFILLIRLF